MKRFLIALILLTTTAWASTPSSHEAWTRVALSRVPVSRHDKTPERAEQHRVNLDVFAAEIARVSEKAPLPPRQWASLLGAIGGAESHFDTAVTAGNCLPLACDKGRARSAFQCHRLQFVADLWDRANGDIAVQVEMADKVLRRTWGTCLVQGVPMPQAAFRGYAGVSCSWPMRGEDLRVAYYVKLMSTPKPGGGT